MIRTFIFQVGILCALIFGALSGAARAQDSRLGATVEGLIAEARTMSPDLAASALSAEAALARAQGAGTLPDPTFRVQLKDIDRARGSIEPTRVNRIDYTVEQEFPLWGKRGLARSVASANAAQTIASRDQMALELVAAVKTAFGDYYAAHEAGVVTGDIKRTLELMAEVAQRRYEQGLGSQQDAIMASVEAAHLQTELLKREADQRRAAARINALLNRPIEAPLAPPETLPRLPPAESMDLRRLVGRLNDSNPILRAQDAAIEAASGTQALAKKSWYPDVALGLSVVDQNRRWQGYEAMVSVKIPINGTLRRAEISAATAELGAARNRRDAVAARAREQLESAFWNFDEAQRIATILHETHIPQTELALKSAVAGYQQNRVDLLTLLEAQRRAFQNRLDHLLYLVNQERAAAEIEKLLGGTL
ncbi:MAG: TolC family protein [Rhodospirillaceae bacterium]|nr:TolC family protein [Rhodospirillaceae bacterium]